jgi:hypothetical protein
MRRHSSIHLTLAFLLVALLSLPVAAQPRGAEPDLPAGNGELAAITAVRADGAEVVCTVWTTKISGQRLAAFWDCYDQIARRTKGKPYASGRVDLPEPRGTVHAVPVVADGELMIVASSPNDETTQVSRQELHFEYTGLPLQHPRQVVLVRADLPLVAR